MFNQNDEIILQHDDEEGNKFVVNKHGKHYASANFNHQNQELAAAAAAAVAKEPYRKYKAHAPRFFVIHKDSTGTELLRYQDVKNYLGEIDLDPMTAIIRENVQGHQNLIGTTILRPLKGANRTHRQNEMKKL